MSAFEHVKNKLNEFVGHVEEVVGGAVGDKAMEVHGEFKEEAAEDADDDLDADQTTPGGERPQD